MARFVLPPLFQWAAKSPEIVLISAISWCLLIGYLAILADFSIAMGALIAGVTLSALPYTLDVVAKIRGLRDFFVTLFFVALGMQLELGSPRVLLAALVLSAVVVVEPLPHRRRRCCTSLGYGPRVGTLCSLALAQAGEFALVIVSIGLALGHIDREITSIMALTLVITSTLSTYMVIANHRLARCAADAAAGASACASTPMTRRRPRQRRRARSRRRAARLPSRRQLAAACRAARRRRAARC